MKNASPKSPDVDDESDEIDAQVEFIDAFEQVLGDESQRRMLILLLEAGREVRYEEWRKAVGVQHKQAFSSHVKDLMHNLLISRRLVMKGGRYESYFSPNHWGVAIANSLKSLGEKGRLPADLPEEFRAEIRAAFMGRMDRDRESVVAH